MNISYPTIKIVTFDKIAPGEVFGYDERLYMRLKGCFVPYDSDGDDAPYSAVCLHNGGLEYFSPSAPVEKVTAYTKVEYDREK